MTFNGLIATVVAFFNSTPEIRKHTTDAVKRLSWQFNLPTRQIGKVTLWSQRAGNTKIVVPAKLLLEVADAEKAAKDAVNNEGAKAATAEGKATEFQEKEAAYRNKKEALIENGEYGLLMTETEEGRALKELRDELQEKHPEYKLAAENYWKVTPANKEAFNIIKSFIPYATQNFCDADQYWETLRFLLPRWAVKALTADARRVAFTTKFERNNSNGVYDYRCYSKRTRSEEEKTEYDRFCDNLRAYFHMWLSAVEIYESGNDAKALINIVKDKVIASKGTPKDDPCHVSEFAIAKAGIPLVDAGWLCIDDLARILGWEPGKVNKFIADRAQEEKDWAIATQKKMITKYTGNVYSLAWYNNLSEDTELQLLKSGMAVNLYDEWKDAIMDDSIDSKEAAWELYMAAPSPVKVNKGAKKVDIYTMSPLYKQARKEAAANVQNNAAAQSALIKSKDFEFNTGDKAWDKMMTEMRVLVNEAVNEQVDCLMASPYKPLAGAGAGNDAVSITAAEEKAAWMLFNKYSEMIANGFDGIQ